MSLPESPVVSAAFGQVLRQVRRARGLSQEQLRFEAELERNFISLLDLGQRSPSLGTLFKLAHALHLKPSTLLTKTETMLNSDE